MKLNYKQTRSHVLSHAITLISKFYFFCVVSDPFTCKINNIHPFSTDLFSEQYRNTTIPKLTSLIKYVYETIYENNYGYLSAPELFSPELSTERTHYFFVFEVWTKPI